MGRKSRDKGKRGEREAATVLNQMLPGCNARRGVQFQGGTESPDVKHDIAGIQFEVKRAERLSPYAALEQAAGDCGALDKPVVLHRRNGKEWIAVMYLDDLVDVADLIIGFDG